MASKPPSTIWPVPGAWAITLNCFRSGSAIAGAPPCSMRGRFGPIATARNGEAFSSGTVSRARFSQPSSVAFRRGVHDGKLILVKERLEGREARVQTEKSVKVDRRIRAAAIGLRNRDRRTHAIVIRFVEGHDDIQAIGRAALKQHDELLLVRHRRGRHGALQKRGHRAQADHGYASLLQEISPRKFQASHAFTAFVTHRDLSCPTAFEIPARPAPTRRRRPDLPACADHRASPATLAGYRVVSRASRPWSAPPARRGILAPRGQARSSRPPRSPDRAAKAHRCVLPAFCFPQEPGNSSAGSTAHRYSPTHRPYPHTRLGAGTDTAARRFALPTAPAAGACPHPCPGRAPRKPPVQTASSSSRGTIPGTRI